MTLDEFSQYVGFTTEPRYEMDADQTLTEIKTIIEAKGSISFYELRRVEESEYDEDIVKDLVLRDLHRTVAKFAPDPETCEYRRTPEGSYLCSGCRKLSPYRLSPGMHCIHCGRVIERIED